MAAVGHALRADNMSKDMHPPVLVIADGCGVGHGGVVRVLGEGGLPATAASVPFATAQLPLASERCGRRRDQVCCRPCGEAAHDASMLGPVPLCGSRCGARLRLQVLAAAAGVRWQAAISSQRLLAMFTCSVVDRCSVCVTSTEQSVTVIQTAIPLQVLHLQGHLV